MSEAYRNKVVAVFNDSGFKVEHRWEATPDEDFVYLSSAHYIVPGGGGFHYLAQQCAIYNGAWCLSDGCTAVSRRGDRRPEPGNVTDDEVGGVGDQPTRFSAADS